MSASPSSVFTPLPVSRAELRARVDRVPRVSLANLPTPLDEVPRFSAALGGPRILIKRDDLTGLAFGGNKTRMLEFRMANALKEGADCIINGAALQSNDCRQTAAAGAKLGLKVYLICREARKRSEPCPQGNYLLDKLLGAEVTVIGREEKVDQRQMMLELAEKLRKEGHKPYLSLSDLHLWSVGYVDCLLETFDQLDQMGLRADRIYMTANLMTHAGILLGARAIGSSIPVVGINPGKHSPDTIQRIVELTNETAGFLGLGASFSRDDVVNLEDYVGNDYGQPTKECIEAIKLLARTESIFVDPVYSGKGMSGLIDHIRQGKIGKDETVVFIHTGGLPSLFAYNVELMAEEEPCGEPES